MKTRIAPTDPIADRGAAANIESDLARPASTGCCGGPPKADASACCVLDEQKKADGQSGCGCGARSATAKAPASPGRCG